MHQKTAENVKDITDCKKLVGYRNVYRIQIGDYKAFFTLHIEIVKIQSISDTS